METAFQRLRSHFAAYRERPKWTFFWRITLEGIAVGLVAIVVVNFLGYAEERTSLIEMTIPRLILLACVVAPVAETLILQSFPVMIARALGMRFWIQVLMSAVPFAALHFMEGIGTGVAAGVVGGFYLAFTYVCWREKSAATAFAMTAGTHAARNAFFVIVALSAGGGR